MAHHELVIIGTGSGNSLLTPELDGLDVGLIEAGLFGGTCLNAGCIPTKMFVAPAERITSARDSSRLGVHFPRPSVDWPAIRDRVFGRIDPIEASGRDYRHGQQHVSVYAARARFVGPRRMALTTGEELTADHVVIAAGSRPVLLDVPGLDVTDPERGVHTSDTIMRLPELPATMAIVGGGFVACEFAQIFSALGVRVTQIQRSDVLLHQEETTVSQRYTELAAARYDLRLDTSVAAARRQHGRWHLDLVTTADRAPVGSIEAEVVLVAIGRRPNTDTLALAEVGYAVDAEHRLVVDDQQRTSIDGVWALGDICTQWPLKHVANHEARVVAHNVALDLGRLPAGAAPQRSDHRFVPHAVFGHPQIAAFGPTRAQLEASGTAYVEATQAYGDVAYGWALEDGSGFLIVYAAPDGQLLAAHCLGPEAATVIQPLIQAASFGQRARDVARGQYWIHPALSEVVENALLALPTS